jgi:DMSO/TMAO reductase YedYZ molybdopterin-dependent catalytic subunit
VTLEKKAAGVARRGITRRSFLLSTAAAAGVTGGVVAWRQLSPYFSSTGGPPYVLPAEPLALLASGKLLDTDFPDPIAGARMLGRLPFISDKQDVEPGTRMEVGRDARRVIDLASLLTPQGRTTPNEVYFIRTEYPNKLDPPKEWKIKIHGAVQKPQELSLASLREKIESKGPVLMECSGNTWHLQYGLMSVGDFDGIPLSKVIDIARPTSKAKAVFINGFDETTLQSKRNHSKPTCSWIFTFDQLDRAGAFLATRINGAPLPNDLGSPVRLMMPGWYGCTEAKWVDEIKFVDNDQPATLQMLEFASRTHQSLTGGVGPAMARDYRPGTMQLSALPVRVEQWMKGDKLVYRLVGITWGARGDRTDNLQISFGNLNNRAATPFVPVQFCQTKTSVSDYGIWLHHWEPQHKGPHAIRLRFEGKESPRLKDAWFNRGKYERAWYSRIVFIPAV